MKYLIYNLFSGVGLCNQLFSFETAIYLSNITNRKLILLIMHPLCHCGKATWDYGYFPNYLSSDYLQYLKNDIDIHYKNIPSDIKNIINDKDNTKHIVYNNNFSSLVFVDDELDINENNKDINDFCKGREKSNMDLNKYDNYKYIYINQSNASRCFYNFYTTQENYKLMYDICKSIKFNSEYYTIANNIYSLINVSNNNKKNHNIFIHLRFGDVHKDINFLSKDNTIMIKNISEFIDNIKKELNLNVILMCDNINNSEFFTNMQKYNYKLIEEYTTNYINDNENYIKSITSNSDIKNTDVLQAIVELILCSYADEFIGTNTSTFSNYIQYLRYDNNKSYTNYSNMHVGNFKDCKLIPVKNSKYDWVKYNYKGGHPISWHCFWDLDYIGLNTE